jgi:hypothetical protein
VRLEDFGGARAAVDREIVQDDDRAGVIAGRSWVSTQVSKASRSIAPGITRGAIRPSMVNPAIRVWVCQRPNGAVPTRRRPMGARP